ncbi:MAG: hypothetical protein IKI69_09010 [Oscillospiraceae bacterium]|nr:hypothetical protein [Oscillospiraceae bacterium]
MAGLEEKVEDMYGKQRGIAKKVKPIDRRLKTLDEHILNAEKYFQYRDIYRKYKQQKPKKQAAFYEKHRMELTHYEAAERYLNAVMNGKTGIPLKAWKAERDKLNGEKKQLTQQYYTLKDEVKEVEQIRRNVHSILREEKSENSRHESMRLNDEKEEGRVAKCAFGAKVTKEYLNIVTGNRRFWRFPVTFLANPFLKFIFCNTPFLFCS